VTAIPERLVTALADRYRIERELGAGGMATVYLAADLKHDRKVAIKVLKPELAAVLGAERFVQEIKTTAALSHPHILPLFDSGEAGGFLYYVMPYIQGETIREKLNRETQFGIEEAVKITTEVADALDYAHQNGVIHRDIKPENILLHNGRPMVMDFGIALAVSAAAGGRMTETGLSLGTPHYMSPEQATADKQITARSDVYSLASVCYEMLAGQPPHLGGPAQQVIMRIITEQARPVSEFRRNVPANVVAALERALEKLPADRFGSAKAFGNALQNPAYVTSGRAGTAAAVGRDWRRKVAVPALILAGVAIAAAGWSLTRPGPVPQVARYEVQLGRFTPSPNWYNLAIDPGGTKLVYVASDAAGSRLAVRPLDQLEVSDIPGTEGVVNPFFSPDGRRLGFMKPGLAVEIVGFDGAPPVTVADTLVGSPGAAWSPDGYIYFDKLGPGGLMRAPDRRGAKAEEFSRIDSASGEQQHIWPDALPNGKGLVFVVNYTGPGRQGGPTDAIAVLDLRTGGHRVLFPGVRVRYAASGHLIYVTTDGVLLAVPFDQDRLEVTGDPVAITKGVRPAEWSGAVDLAISDNGTLVYRAGATSSAIKEIVWASPDGKITAIDSAWQDDITGPALSPDGTQLAVSLPRAGDRSIWIKALRPGGGLAKLSFDVVGSDPWWTADGRAIRFVDVLGNILEAPSEGGQAASMVFPVARGPQGKGFVRSATGSSDGKWIVLEYNTADLYAVRPGVDSAPIPVADSPAVETGGRISPDGRWIAYTSSRTGFFEVYVASLPNVSQSLVQISNAGGVDPHWTRDGRHILYWSLFPNQLVSVDVQGAATFTVGARKALFPLDRVSEWDVAPDGRLLLVRSHDAVSETRQVIVENFFQELKTRARR
jgi:hypothetical protein